MTPKHTARGVRTSSYPWVALLVVVAALTVAVVLRTSGVWRYDGPASRVTPQPPYTTAPDLAAKLGCTFERLAEPEAGVRDQGLCLTDMSDDSPAYMIRVFDGTLQRDAWLRGTYRAALVGPLWVIDADTPATLAAAEAKVGGDLR